MIIYPMLIKIENEGIIARNGMWKMADCKRGGYAVCVTEPHKYEVGNLTKLSYICSNNCIDLFEHFRALKQLLQTLK